MAHPQPDIGALRLLGGRLCIDFVNTVEDRAGDEPEEILTSYRNLARWAGRAGLLSDGEVARLVKLADEDEREASAVLDRALEFREALHRVLLAIARQGEPDSEDLETVRSVYQQAIAGGALTFDGGQFDWDMRPSTPRLDQMLWPVALSAIELLTEGDLRRVKVCANPDGCGWLFYDNSKNASRRWCSMEGCGSQVKMRRLYARRKAQAPASGG